MLTSLLLSLSMLASTDTIVVEKANVEGPFAVSKPYETDSVNMQGKSFDIQSVLKQNQALICSSRTRTATHRDTLQHGAPIALTDGNEAEIRILRFSLQTPSFAKARLDIKGMKNCNVFVNEKECSDKQLQLEPGRTEVALQVLTDKTCTDSFFVKVIGENLGNLEVNSLRPRPYTMNDMIGGDHYYSVRLSPTGKYLISSAYYINTDGKSQYRTTVSEMATGREVIRRNDYADYNWLTRNRDIIYYTTDGTHGREIRLLDVANNSETVLADRLPDGHFTISPKLDYLIYSKNEDSKKENDGLKQLQEPDDRQPGWRSRSTLWRYDVETGMSRQLTYGKQSVWLSDISLSGQYLLLQFSSFDATKMPFDRCTILRMDAYTGKVDTLLSDTIFIAEASFSPDEKQLLIKASPAAFGGIGSEVKPSQQPNGFDYRLYLYDIASKSTIPLLRNFAPSVDNTVWAPGDNKIYFSATDGCDETLFRLDATTRKLVRYKLPVSYVSRFSIADMMRQPSVVFFGQTGERAREMFTCTLAQKAEPKCRRIGSIDFDQMYRDVAIGTCHDWSFQASRGDTIKGFYFLPPDFDSTKKYPLIVYYYGGCTPTGKTLEFQYPLQVLAGQGYIVYVCEPSGAIGYGQEFAARHVNTWGKESGDDIIEGTKQFLKEHPYANAAKVGCMGASYGGFMTQYLQTRTDLFATAVSHAGISNIASYWGGGYWGYSYGQTAQYGSYPWNNPDLYVKQSPLFNADKIHTPLLLLHGTADTNVPTNESQQLFTALKILGREVAYIQVDGENHVITNYSKRMAWQKAIFAWFAKHLKDEPLWWNTLFEK